MPLSLATKKLTNAKLFGAVNFDPSANYYLALAKTAPVDGVFSEADYGSYARIAVANNQTTFSVPGDDADATITNAIEVRFPVVTSGSNTLPYVVVMDATTEGNIVGYAEAATSKTYAVGDRPVYEIGSLLFKMKDA
jgi:hypothetical protein